MQIRRSLRALFQHLFPCMVALSTVLLVACYPYPENRPTHRGPKPGPVTPTVEKTEAEKLKEQEKLAKEKEKKAAEDLKKAEKEKAEEKPKISENEETTPPEKKPEPPKRVDYEVAKKAPGKEGFVLSPYNQKLIDVRGFKSGALVRDPTYDPSEKKYFRVP